jgi:tRNA pseudouridine55 synthase
MKAFGIIVVEKPVGPTSHQVVSIVRRGTGVRKVGHAGTLDPRASGVLVLCLGPATRLSEYLSTSEKRYHAVIRLGESTETYDTEGPSKTRSDYLPTLEEIQRVLPEFVGDIEQVPPPYSAIKVEGKRAYELARAGEDVELESREVTIEHLDVERYDPPDLTVSVECSAGTYIRSLAHDIGNRLGVGGHLASLHRTSAGVFSLADAVPLEELEKSIEAGTWEQHLHPPADALPDMPLVVVGPEELERVRHGQQIEAAGTAQGLARGVDEEGELVAILQAVEDGARWHPRKVFIR